MLPSTTRSDGIISIPFGITASASLGRFVLGIATSWACSAVGFYSRIATCPRAILRRSVALTTIKQLAAIGANVCVATVARHGPWGSWHKDLPASGANNRTAHDWQASICARFRMQTIKSLFRFAVADRTKRNQVVHAVGFYVGLKQMKRYFVMNCQGFTFAAPLTHVIVAPQCLLSLDVPILASIVQVPTLPNWIIGAAPCVRSSPQRKALTTTKTVLMDVAGRTLRLFATNVACYRHSLTPSTDSMDSLPQPVASSIAKMMLGEGFSICLCLKRLTALIAR